MNFNVAILTEAVPEGRVFGMDQQTLISTGIMLLNVCILAVILGVILYKPVQQFMRRRTDRIVSLISDAREKSARAEELKAEYEQKLKEIDRERNEILDEARQTAAENSRSILDEAKNEAESILRRAEQNIQNEKKRLKEETRLYIIEASSLMAEKLVRKTVDSQTHSLLFDETMAQLEDTTWPS